MLPTFTICEIKFYQHVAGTPKNDTFSTTNISTFQIFGLVEVVSTHRSGQIGTGHDGRGSFKHIYCQLHCQAWFTQSL